MQRADAGPVRAVLFLMRLILWLPALYAFYLEQHAAGPGWAACLGLALQALIGPALIAYPRVTGVRHPSWSEWGLFASLLLSASCYFVGRSLWLPVLWEASTFLSLAMYAGGPYSRRAGQSVGSLLFASSVSGLLLAAWVMCPSDPHAMYFLLGALLLKTAFFGLHLWLPDAYGGAPAQAVAFYAGLAVNLPFVLYVQHVHDHWVLPPWLLNSLFLISSFGVFYGGLTALFKRDSQRLLGYSSIECVNTLWCCLLLDLFLKSRSIESVWLPVFAFLLVHYSFSKTYQFLVIGYAQRIAGSHQVDALKGSLRSTELSPVVMGMGAFSFLGIPGTPGFLAEGALFVAIAGLFSREALSGTYLIPGICWLLFGVVMGGMAHYRLYLSTSLGVPDRSLETQGHPRLLQRSLVELSFWMLCAPLALLILIYLDGGAFAGAFVWQRWLVLSTVVSAGVYVIFACAYGLGWRHKIRQRKLWDCGSNYAGSDLSVPASVYADPVYASVGKYFLRPDGTSFLDRFLQKFIAGLFDVGHYWSRKIETGSVSTYLRFAINFAVASVTLLYVIRIVIGGAVS